MNKKALSPVVASIILIAVTIAASIAVVAWMGTLTVGIMGKGEVSVKPEDITIEFNDEELKAILGENNITIIQSPQKLMLIQTSTDYYSVEIREGKQLKNTYLPSGPEFVESLKQDNVTYILCDYAPFAYPDRMQPNTNYNLESYSYWYYKNLPNVGEVAIVYHTQVYAWYEES